MQRLFSSFPAGGPGVGLLLLRAAVGLALLIQGGAGLLDRNQDVWIWMAGLLALVTGAFLVIGFLTPIAGVLAVLDGVSAAFSWHVFGRFGGATAAVFLVVMAVAVALLGPGAFSLDARLFGRREVVIP